MSALSRARQDALTKTPQQLGEDLARAWEPIDKVSLLIEAGVTLGDLSELTGVSRAGVSMWVTDRSRKMRSRSSTRIVDVATIVSYVLINAGAAPTGVAAWLRDRNAHLDGFARPLEVLAADDEHRFARVLTAAKRDFGTM